MAQQSDKSDKVLRQMVESLKINDIDQHLFLCLGEKCCTHSAGQESWEYLKRRVRELGLADAGVYRTKVGCLRVCCEGPIGLLYPDGTWYKHMTPANIERVLQEHVLGGRVVKDLAFAQRPLSPNAP